MSYSVLAVRSSGIYHGISCRAKQLSDKEVTVCMAKSGDSEREIVNRPTSDVLYYTEGGCLVFATTAHK